ncbi:hypothetical protein EMCRGX_G009991 [Ephydatia muelleri]
MQGSNYVCLSCFHLLRRRCFAPDGFDAVSVQNVGSTYIIVSWDLPTHSNGILINFSLYCNGALAGVLPLTVISYNTTGLLPFTLYMYMSSSHAHRHCTPVGTWCWASSVLQSACPVLWLLNPMCILLQLSSLLVEHTAPNIHDSNKYCCLCWPWGLTATTKPTRAVQDSVADTYPMEELTATPPYPSWSRTWAWVICPPPPPSHKLEILDPSLKLNVLSCQDQLNRMPLQ